MNEIMGEIGAPGPSITPVGVAVDAQGNKPTDYGTGVVYKYDPLAGTYASVFPNRRCPTPKAWRSIRAGDFSTLQLRTKSAVWIYKITMGRLQSLRETDIRAISRLCADRHAEQTTRNGSFTLPGTSVNFLYWADTGTRCESTLVLGIVPALQAPFSHSARRLVYRKSRQLKRWT